MWLDLRLFLSDIPTWAQYLLLGSTYWVGNPRLGPSEVGMTPSPSEEVKKRRFDETCWPNTVPMKPYLDLP